MEPAFGCGALEPALGCGALELAMGCGALEPARQRRAGFGDRHPLTF